MRKHAKFRITLTIQDWADVPGDYFDSIADEIESVYGAKVRVVDDSPEEPEKTVFDFDNAGEYLAHCFKRLSPR